MKAESKDGIVWKKTGILEFLKPQKGYDSDDWRDPFIIWDEEQKEYLLILGTRLEGTKKGKTGRIVYYTSKDYETWDFKGDFWSPEIYTMIEMPEIVKIGPYWYLLYSEYDDKKQLIIALVRIYEALGRCLNRILLPVVLIMQHELFQMGITIRLLDGYLQKKPEKMKIIIYGVERYYLWKLFSLKTVY